MESIILHVDVNSAYLAWSAVWDLAHGAVRDLRKLPAIVGGDPENRHGIVLAKSVPAKAFGIVTGETLFSALAKCPDLVIVPPRYQVYVKASEAMVEILSAYSPVLERYSIDECFLDMGPLARPEALRIAHQIRREIKRTLGFTVNVGIGTNKLCAKMASDFKKPDLVHTLYPEEVEVKLHGLPIEDLFMVGPALAKRLRNINLSTIGQLARCDRGFLAGQFGKIGMVIWNFAWGRDSSKVHPEGTLETKGMGNSTTLPHDLTERPACHRTLLSLLETLVPRLKAAGFHTTCVAVHYTTTDFKTRRRQRQLPQQTDSMPALYEIARALFDEIWEGQAVRKLGVSFSHLRSNQVVQLSLLDLEQIQKKEKLDDTVLQIRQRFGDDSLIRGTFISSDTKPFSGGVDEPGFKFMNSNL